MKCVKLAVSEDAKARVRKTAGMGEGLDLGAKKVPIG
jgi:hypothetical protein